MDIQSKEEVRTAVHSYDVVTGLGAVARDGSGFNMPEVVWEPFPVLTGGDSTKVNSADAEAEQAYDKLNQLAGQEVTL